MRKIVLALAYAAVLAAASLTTGCFHHWDDDHHRSRDRHERHDGNRHERNERYEHRS